MEVKYPVVVLADGVFPRHVVGIQKLLEAQTIVCCDGAADKLLAYGMEPHYVVGDLDSINKITRQQFEDRMYYDCSQEINDLTKAVRFCDKLGANQITILGATGLREDHTIANISLLADYIDLFPVEMITDYGIFTAIRESTTFDSVRGQQVSIFSLTSQTRVTLEGLRYPLKEAILDSWWKGSLNESDGETFTIRFDDGKVIVFQAF